MKYIPLLVTGIALLIGVALFIATDGIGNQQRMTGEIFKNMQLKVGYTPMGEPKIFANVPATALRIYAAAEGSNAPGDQAMVIGAAEAKMMRSEKLFMVIGDRFESFFGVPTSVGGVLAPTESILDDMHFLSSQQYNDIEGESGRAYIIRTEEGMPKLFYLKKMREQTPLPLKLQEGNISQYVPLVFDGKIYYPVIVGSTEAKMMREEKLFVRQGDRIENFFGANVFIAGVLNFTNSSVDMMHIVFPGTIDGASPLDYLEDRDDETALTDGSEKMNRTVEGAE